MTQSFEPELAEFRFGCGLSADIPPPESPAAMLNGLAGPDVMLRRFPAGNLESVLSERRDFQAELQNITGANVAQAKLDLRRKYRGKLRRQTARRQTAVLLRRAKSPTPFRERLTQFWADHFTATGKTNFLRSAQASYVDEAIRPNLGGSFGDMLFDVIRHPVMLSYLDQDRSVGPNSKRALRTDRPDGLNENLAREVLELHTLGVDGKYTQTDVRELAELFTGLTSNIAKGFVFDPRRAEPGQHVILGETYRGASDGLSEIRNALFDLARRPETARHLAHKLAIHFVSDHPAADLTEAMAAAYLAEGASLMAMYEVLLNHPAAWSPIPANVKQPLDFLGSALRALNVRADAITAMKPQQLNLRLLGPMDIMGHNPTRPKGPDGLPEEDAAWITPHSIAARLRWAMTVPISLRQDLPDPRTFAQMALGSRLSKTVAFAASAAETRWEGIGLVLSAPAFQRM